MDQYIDNRQKEIFWELLANPADKGATYTQSLDRLVADNPQSAILQALAARAREGQPVSKAAVYIDPRLLHKLVNDPQGLPVVDISNITDLTYINGTPSQAVEESPVEDTVIVPAVRDESVSENINEDEPPIAETQVIDEPQDVAEGPITEEEQLIDSADATAEQPADSIEDQPVDEIAEAPFITHEPEPVAALQDEVSEPEAESHQEQFVAGQEELAPLAEQALDNAAIPEGTPSQPQPEEQLAEPQFEAPKAQPTNNGYYFPPRFPKREEPAKLQAVANEPQTQSPAESIEDEIYDEIVGIEEIGFQPVASTQQETTEHRFSEPVEEPAINDEPEQPAALFHQPDAQPEAAEERSDIQNEEDKLILGGIVGGDYLSFDKKLDELRNTSGYVAPKFKPEEPKQEPQAAGEKAPEPVAAAAEPQPAANHTIDPNQVSRYDDDKMPYTFLWWLNKTRKEHAENIRPYAAVQSQPAAAANPADNIKRADELQQQYFENIFSLTSVSGIESAPEPERVAFDPNKKEDVIIERFIQTDPQIKPLSADKLDNENKAKRSSEDTNEVVTETLARIYADQMLYHKAIATYKKLILKFPEKSTYFAGRIEELEKKTN